MNVLIAPFNTRYETAPFSKIRNIDFIPAFEKAIDEAKKSIDINATVRGKNARPPESVSDCFGQFLDRFRILF